MKPEQIERMKAGRLAARQNKSTMPIAEIYSSENAMEIKDHLAVIARETPVYVGLFKKAYSGRSLSAAVKAACVDCCCWQRVEITRCQTVICPLWLYRPYQLESEKL